MLRLSAQTASTSPRQLTHYGSVRGFEPNTSLPVLLCFGAVLTGGGSFAVLAGLRLIQLPGRLNVPHWVFALLGAMVIVVGLFLWQRAWRTWRFDRDSTRARLCFPDEPAMADRPWNPAGESSNLAAKAWRSTQIALFLTFMAVPGVYIWFTEKGTSAMAEGIWFARALFSLFGVLALAIYVDAARRWLRALKFGRSHLRFARFPFRLGEPVQLTWTAPDGCAGEASGRFILRAVVESYQSSPHAGRRSGGTIVHEQRWAGQLALPAGARITPGEQIELVFTPPVDAPATSYHAQHPIFWELEVALSLPGLDYKETYPVPVYASARSSSTPAHA